MHSGRYQNSDIEGYYVSFRIQGTPHFHLETITRSPLSGKASMWGGVKSSRAGADVGEESMMSHGPPVDTPSAMNPGGTPAEDPLWCEATQENEVKSKKI